MFRRGPHGDSDDEARDTNERANLIHREILQLALLIGFAVIAFFVTRGIAGSNRDMSLRDGREWYQRGEGQLADGDVDAAIDSFRRATVRNRDDKRYVLALARALASKRQDEAARSALLALRESSPEDPEINLQLARLGVERGDVTEALRYYHSTLYAPWPAEQAAARRRVRLELIDFLLTHDQTNRALSELLAISSDLPEDAALHVQVGARFSTAGDSRHALDQFHRALKLSPEDGAALAGAGLAAFQLGDYPLAQRYLRAAPGVDGVTAAREVTERVISNDPLASRLGRAERRRRVIDDLAFALQRFEACLKQGQSGDSSSENDRALQEEARALQAQLRAGVREPDTIESGVEVVFHLERAAIQACPPVQPRDRALILIAQRHGVDQR